MARVPRGLVDQVAENPAEVCARGTPRTRLLERHAAHCRVGRFPARPIRGAGRVERELIAGCELGFVSRGVQAVHAAVDPAPLDVGEVIHDADDGDELRTVDAPAGLLVAESLGVTEDRTAEIAEP